ncbi:MAG: Undecaprenyl pyrophosphate synthetase [Oscillospiraceae bacterium]|jgi:undecaprenyl diphosphate synthase|nr:Undecaprenyl pyrophosphate synthetase [Oscillospiraceae bacterium]
MDGNGRWAEKRGLPRKFGHREGAKTFKKIVRYCKKIGIKYASFFAFSTENWKRPKEEVDAIIELFEQYIDDVRSHVDEEVRVIFLGDKSVFSSELQKKMVSLEEDSKEFDKMTLLLAINYGGKDDIVHSVKQIAKLVREGTINPEQIDEGLVSSFLYTKGLPDVDFIIRPSGEQRISNFLIWQSAYAEFYFTDVLWPDFSERELDKALLDYASRGRRFGGI